MTSCRPRNSSIIVTPNLGFLKFCGIFGLLSRLSLGLIFFFCYFVLAVLSDDVPLVVSRQLLQTLARELGRLQAETQKEIANYTLAQIQPRVVSFEEQVPFELIGLALFCSLFD